ncbi:unnamed protein product [Moneuplotes crassus]|uniref:Uncharacterized protein n=1 Tax=Euplotes crassus TaxID=5936 RepID=A0AAD1XBH7_EUPCR|nr:unnamed protein product [Moneuplotes crassus]
MLLLPELSHSFGSLYSRRMTTKKQSKIVNKHIYSKIYGKRPSVTQRKREQVQKHHPNTNRNLALNVKKITLGHHKSTRRTARARNRDKNLYFKIPKLFSNMKIVDKTSESEPCHILNNNNAKKSFWNNSSKLKEICDTVHLYKLSEKESTSDHSYSSPKRCLRTRNQQCRKLCNRFEITRSSVEGRLRIHLNLSLQERFMKTQQKNL